MDANGNIEMIDYEKLKLASELSNKNDGEIYYAYQNKDGVFIQWVSLDQLILELESLIKPKPKYKVGDIVFYRNDLGIRSFRIDEINEDGELWYINRNNEGDYGDNEGSFDQYQESDLFPTRQALIEHQIQHWQNQLEDELEQHVSSYCEPLPAPQGIEACQKRYDHLFVRGKCYDCGFEEPDIQSNQSQVDVDRCQHEYESLICVDDSRIFRCLKCQQLKPVDCQHESDGLCYTSYPSHNKCVKCGDFYR